MGGIESAQGALTLNNSTVTGNTAVNGGGIRQIFTGTLNLNNSTVSGNTATGFAGGLWIANEGAVCNLVNSIVAGNSASSGPDIENDQTINLPSGVSIIGDLAGSGLAAGPSLLVGNPLLKPLGDYGGPTETMLPYPDSPVVDAGGAVDPGGTDQRGAARFVNGALDIGAVELDLSTDLASFGATGFLPADTATSVSPGPELQWTPDGSPSSQEVFLDDGAGGPLVSIGTTTGSTLLVPGLLAYNTTYSWRVDSTFGATTSTGPVLTFTTRGPLVVNTTADENDGIDVNDVSLRDAVAAAAPAAPETITFDPALDGLTILLTQAAEIPIDRSMTIDASTLPNGITVDAGGDVNGIRHFSISGAGNTVTLDSLTLTEGRSGSNAASIHAVDAVVHLLDCHFSRNLGDGNGGALFLQDVEATITGCSFDSSRSANKGGAIYQDGGSLLLGSSSASANISVDGAAIYSSNGTLTILGSTFSLNAAVGESGGAIFIESGLLQVSDSLFLGNSASIDGGAVCIGSTANATIERTTLDDSQSGDGDGGAICNFGALTLDCSSVINNRADDAGGGIFNGPSASAMISGSTISDNRSNDDEIGGGGIAIAPGAIVTITNSTIIDNYCEFIGGGIAQEGTLTIESSTVIGNTCDSSRSAAGGGIYVMTADSLTIINTIVAGNEARDSNAGGDDIGLDTGTVNVIGPNLIGSNDSVEVQFPAGPLAGTDAAPLAPLLHPLGSYGGPTETAPPRFDSPAVDAGGATTLIVDQSGAPRVVNGTVDLGAVELPLVLAVTNTDDDGPGSLRQALLLIGDGGVIDFDSTLAGTTLIVPAPLSLDQAKALTVDAGSLPNGIALSGNQGSQIMNTTAGSDTTLIGLHLTRGNTIQEGGALKNEGALNLQECTISKCSSGMNGGAICNSGDVSLLNTTISGNLALFEGGGIWNSGSVSAIHSTISDNEAFFFAGGGASNSGALTLENSILAGNFADFDADLSGNAAIEFGNNLNGGNPGLSPLQDFGGPTPVMAPLPGSAAIEGAVLLGGSPLTDQLGNSRPTGPLPDIGAVEAFQVSSVLALSSGSDTDNDTIPDFLEGPNGPYPQLSVGTDDSGIDSDGDGSPDSEEIGNMTDPFDGSDSLRVLSIRKAAGFDPQNRVMQIKFKTFPGLSYEIEFNPLLNDPFTPVPGTEFIATESESTIEVPAQPGRNNFRARRK